MPSVTPRSEVGFNPPINGPAFEPQFVDGIVWHWAGGDVNLIMGEASVLRTMQTMYVSSPTRGYSLGYSYAVGPSGAIYEIRGLKFRPASNGDLATNRRAPSVLILCAKMVDDVTPAQLESLRWLTGYIQEQVPTATRRYGHRDMWPTACPGDRFHADIHAGRFEPAASTPQQEDLMPVLVRDPSRLAVYSAIPGFGRVWVENGNVLASIKAAYPNIGEVVSMSVADQYATFGQRLGRLPEHYGFPGEVE